MAVLMIGGAGEETASPEMKSKIAKKIKETESSYLEGVSGDLERIRKAIKEVNFPKKP
jgi:hypothetical protein